MPDTIHYTSDGLQLKGYVFKPKGKGPFPILMWNHDTDLLSEGIGSVFNNITSSFWVKKGYVFFMPIRSGFSGNEGPYICDEEEQIKRRKETEQVQFKQIYALHKKANDDIIAALKWIKKQPYADSNNIVVSGDGYGGIEVLLIAEKDGQSPLGIKSFIAICPAYEIWNTLWGDSLTNAINAAKRPIFLLQAEGDHNTLCPALDKKGFPNRYEIDPGDIIIWRKQVLKFLKDCGVKGKK